MELLKLFALDRDDLDIVSAHVQDAVLQVGDMAYLPREQRFVLICNRFDRSPGPAGAIGGPPQRRRAALRLERVQSAQIQGVDRSARGTVLSLLALQFEPAVEPSGQITLVFAGNAAIRLTVESIELALEDLGPAWAASATPVHPDLDVSKPIGASE
jgi:Protein of unknown function (DUF2948)